MPDLHSGDKKRLQEVAGALHCHRPPGQGRGVTIATHINRLLVKIGQGQCVVGHQHGHAALVRVLVANGGFVELASLPNRGKELVQGGYQGQGSRDVRELDNCEEEREQVQVGITQGLTWLANPPWSGLREVNLETPERVELVNTLNNLENVGAGGRLRPPWGGCS